MRIERDTDMLAIADVEVQVLESVPDVRAEMVARGKALIADPNYPSKEQLKGVASVLARKWTSRVETQAVTRRGIRPEVSISCCE